MSADRMTDDDLAGLPEDVREEIQRASILKIETLGKLGREIAKLRDEAVEQRKSSGIEKRWMECEEQYLGIDDLNRGEFDGARWAKPLTMDGGLTRENKKKDDSKATIFINETRRYVDAGAAKVCEVTLPMDGEPFTLKNTPVPELGAAKEDDTPAEQVTGQAMPGPDGQPLKVSDLAKHQIELAEKAAEKACARIYDWMVEYKHPAEIRKVVFDGARIGVGVLKGPIPEVSRAIKASKTQDEAGKTVVGVEIVEKTKPVGRWVDPWCFYPAPGCGEDIHKGGHTFEVDPMLPGELLALGKKGFDQAAIDRVIQEGPGKCHVDGRKENDPNADKQFEVWHFYGQIPRTDFEAANDEQASELEKAKDTVFAIVTLVNDTVIRAVLNPLESGKLPYHVFCWGRRAGHWAGVGVAEQVSAPQRLLNSATRAMVNNAAASAGSHVIMDDQAVEPAAQGDYRLGTGDKLWLLKKGAGVDDVRKVFASFNWPNTTAQLMSLVDFAMKQFEEHSSIPLITQGQSGDTTPDTFGGQQLQDNNANQLLREKGFNLNDQVTTPFVDMMYEWLLLDTEISPEEKGDFQVDTSGAMAIIEKALQNQFLPQLVQASANPAYGLNPQLCMEGLIRSMRMVPSQFAYTEAEREEMAQQPPPKDPTVEAAEIRAKATIEAAQSRDALLAERNKADLDRDTALVDSQARRDETMHQARMAELQLKERIAILEYATQERISLQDAKVALARDALKLNMTAELAKLKTDPDSHDEPTPKPVITPPIEPAGKADEGRSFEQ